MRLSLRGLGSVLTVGLVACLPYQALAQTAISGVAVGNQAWGGTLGQVFTLSGPARDVTSLGAFDGAVVGFAAGTTITVGISNTTYTTIFTQTTFTNVAAGVPGSGSFTFKTLGAPVTLSAGNYLLFAYGYNASDLNFNTFGAVSPFTLNTFGGSVSYGSSPFAIAPNSVPNIAEPQTGRYGFASFAFSPLGVAPEPGTLALLGLGIMAGAVARRRRA